MKKVLRERLKAGIRKAVTCPISHGPYEPIIINQQAFIDICTIQLNMPWSWPNKALVDATVCGNCEILKAIKEGKEFIPPPGITIVSLQTLIERRKRDAEQEIKTPEKKRYSEP